MLYQLNKNFILKLKESTENERTKIVCTIGPASEAPEKLAALANLGMNVARLNFSHGDHEEHCAITQLKKSVKTGHYHNSFRYKRTRNPLHMIWKWCEFHTGICSYFND